MSDPNTETKRLGDDALLRAILPVGRSPWAILAGYLGLFSLLIFLGLFSLLIFPGAVIVEAPIMVGGVPGPVAVLVSIIAIVDIRQQERYRGMGRAVFGLIAGTLATVVLVYLLAAA